MTEENKETIVEPEVVSEIIVEEGTIPIQTEEEPKKKHSKLGIASFLLALVSGFIIIIGVVISTRAVLSISDPTSLAMNPESMGADLLGPMMIAGVVMMLGGGLSFIGMILGIVGLFMKNTKKIFSIIGTILNGLPLIGVILLAIIGIAMQGAM